MRAFFDGLFNLLYGLFGVPLFLIIIVLLAYVVLDRRKRRKMREEDQHGHSPVEKFEEDDKKK